MFILNLPIECRGDLDIYSRDCREAYTPESEQLTDFVPLMNLIFTSAIESLRLSNESLILSTAEYPALAGQMGPVDSSGFLSVTCHPFVLLVAEKRFLVTASRLKMVDTGSDPILSPAVRHLQELDSIRH